MKDIPLFVSVNEKCVPDSLRCDPIQMKNLQSCRIPSLITAGDTVIAMCDRANSGADWGFIELVQRRSLDGGKSFSEIETVFSPPVRKAPENFNDYSSSFAIDPLTVCTTDGTVILLFDFFPESKGLHKRNWIEKTDGYTIIDGKKYMILYDGQSALGKKVGKSRKGKTFTVRENGFIFDSQGNKTKYYLPQNHNPEYAYNTLGDMYYAVDGGEYIDSYPPLFPKNKDNRDIYVGNIFLNYGKKKFSANKPVFIQKKHSENGKYSCIETSPAPLRAAVTSYLYMSVSCDNGKSWSQPVDITQQVKPVNDGAFFGTGPGRGVCLQNGRILMPVYSLKNAYVIYSDNDGKTWNIDNNCQNIDECQLCEYSDGTVACVGRPKTAGRMPYSISSDGGITWNKSNLDIYGVKCQHSILTVPKRDYYNVMDNSKDYLLILRPTGHDKKDSTRTDGKVSLCEVTDCSVKEISSIFVKTDDCYKCSEDYADFFAYSCMTELGGGKFGVLYEPFPSGYIAFANFCIKDFFSSEDI